MKTTSQKLIQGLFLVLLFGGFLGVFWQIPSALNANPFPDSKLTTNPTVKIQDLSQGVINSNSRRIFYWVQASDIHVNAEHDLDNIENLEKLCDAINDTLRPAFVMATGDNVDAQDYVQNEAEYQIYSQILAKYNFTSEFWYAMLGNHDTYDSNLNRSLFTTYLRNETQYAVDFNPGFGYYRFYMLDSTQKYSLSTFLNLYGDMQTNELDNFQGLINANPQLEIKQSVIGFHHPLNEINSQKSANGSDFRNLIEETNAQFILNGHIHSTNLYVNRETFSEVQCPSLKQKQYYRICAFDNDLMSFSDVQLNEYPQVVITNPTDARFYNDNMDLEKMITQTEIRTLIFDNESVSSAYATIDGKIIGNLTNQGNNLWTVSYNPQYYRSNTHRLSIYVQSASGEVVKEQDFQLSNFEATEIDSSIINIYYKAPLYQAFVGLFIGLICLGLFRLLYPFGVNYYRIRKNLSLKYDPQELPSRNSVVSILGLYGFVLTAPVLVGMLNSSTFGAIFFSHIMVPNGYIFDMETFLIAGIFVILINFLVNWTYRINGLKSHRLLKSFPIFFHYTALSGLVIFALSKFQSALFLSPSLYVFALAPFYLIIEKLVKNKDQQ